MSKREAAEPFIDEEVLDEFLERFSENAWLGLFFSAVLRRVLSPDTLVHRNCMDWAMFAVFWLNQLLEQALFEVETKRPRLTSETRSRRSSSSKDRPDEVEVSSRKNKHVRSTQASSFVRNYLLGLACMTELDPDNQLMNEECLEVVRERYWSEKSLDELKTLCCKFQPLKKGLPNFRTYWGRLHDNFIGSQSTFFESPENLEKTMSFLLEDDRSWKMNAKDIVQKTWDLTSEDTVWNQIKGVTLQLPHGQFLVPGNKAVQNQLSDEEQPSGDVDEAKFQEIVRGLPQGEILPIQEQMQKIFATQKEMRKELSQLQRDVAVLKREMREMRQVFQEHFASLAKSFNSNQQ